MAPSHAGAQLMTATQQLIVRKLPTPTAPIRDPTSPVRSWTNRHSPRHSDYPAHREVSVPPSTSPTPCEIPVIRLRKPATASWFVPGRPVSNVYPHGYQLAELGPDAPH